MVDRRDRERRDSFESLMARLNSRTRPPKAPNIPNPTLDPLTNALGQTSVDFSLAAKLTEQRIEETQAQVQAQERPDLRAAHDAVELFERTGVADILRAWNDQVLEGRGQVAARTVTDDTQRYKLSTTHSVYVNAPDLIVEDPRDVILGPIYKRREAISHTTDSGITTIHGYENRSYSNDTHKVSGARLVYASEGVSISFNGEKTRSRDHMGREQSRYYDYHELSIKDKSVPPPSDLQIPDLLPFARGRVSIYRNPSGKFDFHLNANLAVVEPINEEGVEIMRYFIIATLAYLSIPRLKDPLSERVRRAEEELAKFRSKAGTIVDQYKPLEVIRLRK